MTLLSSPSLLVRARYFIMVSDDRMLRVVYADENSAAMAREEGCTAEADWP